MYPSIRHKPHTLSALSIAVWQTVAVRFIHFLQKCNGRLTINCEHQFKSDEHYIFVSNHQSRWDPFAIFGELSLKANIKLVPGRFLTSPGVFNSPVKPLVSAMGCYPPKNNRNDTVNETINFLRQGYFILIFPEGRRTLQADSQPKAGLQLIMEGINQELRPVMILTHIQWHRTGRWRRDATIVLKVAPDELLKQDAHAIMDAVYKV